MQQTRIRVLFVVLALAAVYIIDDVWIRFRIPPRQQPFGTVTVQRYDAIPEKNGKIEFDPEPPVVQTCVRSLFPHMGYAPCWYLSRNAEQRINY